MNRLLLILPSLVCVCYAADQAPPLHVLHVDIEDSQLSLKLAALADKALHEQCLRYIENPPEPDEPEEDPARYELEKEWAQEEGGYMPVGRSCVTAVKANLVLTDATGTVYTPKETEIKEENGILLATLAFDLAHNQQLPQLDSLSISGSVEYAAHYNMESELSEPVDFSLPCQLKIGDYIVKMSAQPKVYVAPEAEPEVELEEEEEMDEEEIEEDDSDEEYDEGFYAEEDDEEIENIFDKDTASGHMEILPAESDKDLPELITNVIIYEVEDDEMCISGTFGNRDIKRFGWYDYTCNENVLPQQGKISLRLRKKAHPRRYQFNQTLPILPTE